MMEEAASRIKLLYKFVVTSELSRLARWLRLIGYDTIISTSNKIDFLHRICSLQSRILLTRMKHSMYLFKSNYVYIDSDKHQDQLKQVIKALNLKDFILFRRCLICNRILSNITKEKIEHLLPDKANMRFQQFTYCKKCGRIYWKGTHYETMLDFLHTTVQDYPNVHIEQYTYDG